MRIAIFSDSYEPQINGVVTQLNNLLKELAAKKVGAMLFAPSPDSKYREEVRHGVRMILLPSIGLPTYGDYRITNFFSLKALSEVSKFAPDVIHCHTPFGVGWIGVQAGKALKVPVVGTYHTLLPEFMMYLPIPGLKDANFAKKITWHYTNLFYNNCKIVTTPTGLMKKELEKHGMRAVCVLPNAIDYKSFSASRKKNYKSDKLRMIYFGRISYEKNIEVLIFALRKLVMRGVKAELTITGSGPAVQHLRAIAAEENISEFVHFTGPKKPQELPALVASHDVFVTASTIETQGLTILESMATGLPCVCASAMAIPDSVKNGKNGFLFKPFDSDGAADRLEKLASSEKLRKKLGKTAVKFAERFSIERIMKQTILLYKKAMGRARA